MDAQYKCIKTYYVRDKTGSMTKFELPTIICSDLETDLIGCKNLCKNGFRIIFDSDPRVAGIYPKAKDGSVDLTTSIGFDEREDLYVIQSYGSADTFQMGNGYSAWHH